MAWPGPCSGRYMPSPSAHFRDEGSALNIWAVSCPWIRKDLPRLLVLLPGYMVALTRHQYVRRRLRSSRSPIRYQNHIQLSTADTTLSSQRIIDDCTTSYPNSKWDNIRNNMGQDTSRSTSPKSLPTFSGPSSGDCAGVAAWSSSVGYRLKACLLVSTLTSRTRLSTRADKWPPTVFVSNFMFERS